MAAEPGPSRWRNADVAALGRFDGGLAVLCDWIGVWTQAIVPPKTLELWTAASTASLDCGPKKPDPGQQMPQLYCAGGGAREGDRWLNQPTWDLGRQMLRRRSCARTEGGPLGCPALPCASLMPMSTCPLAKRTLMAEYTSPHAWRVARAMQVMFMFGLEHTLKKLDEGRLAGVSRISLQDDMTFIGSAKTLHRNWCELEHAVTEAGQRLRSHKCSNTKTRTFRERSGTFVLTCQGNVRSFALLARRPKRACSGAENAQGSGATCL